MKNICENLKYKNIIGYGYRVYTYDINTYIIVKTKTKIKFILYKWYEFSSSTRKKEIIELLEKEGFKNLDLYNEENIKKLVKEGNHE